MVYLPPFIALIALIFLDKKLNMILYLIVCACTLTANNILKNLYHQPRPYMTTNFIQGFYNNIFIEKKKKKFRLKCNADYGKPSGHAMNSVVLVVLLVYLIYPEIFKIFE